jgi:hypothetical protein
MLFEEGALPLEPINFYDGCSVRSSTRRSRSVRPCEPELRVVVALVWREAAAELCCGASRGAAACSSADEPSESMG